MKFKSNIEIQAGVEAGGNTGSNGQVLSSTGSGVAWINQSAVTSASDFVFFNVKNETGSTILKGKGVMAVGTNGNSGQILVDEMVADGTVEPKYFLGVLEESISNGGTARVISFGQLSQFNTNGQNGETWADGQILWCDPDSPGDFTITEPDGPNVKIAAAFIINSSTNGKIQVRVQANEGVHDMHDTKITSQVDGDLLVWDNTTGVWINDSTLNVDYTNNKVGIGTTSPSFDFTIESTSKISNIGIGALSGNGFTPYEIGHGFGGGNISSKISFETDNPPTNFYGDAIIFSITPYTLAPTGTDSTSEVMRITNDGKLGIGTTSPDEELEVNGNIKLSETAATTDTDKFVVLDSGVLKYRTGTQLLSDIGAGSGTVTSVGGTGTVSGLTLTGTVTTSGNLTLGGTLTLTSGQITTGLGFTPYNATNPAGYTTNTGTVTGTGTTNYISKWTSATAQGNSQIFDNGTNIGIGTTSPNFRYETVDTSQDQYHVGTGALTGGGSLLSYNIGHGYGSGNVTSKIGFVGDPLAPAYYIADAITFSVTPAVSTPSTNDSSVEAMRITSDGDVGIGTTSPDELLHVEGNIKVTDALLSNQSNTDVDTGTETVATAPFSGNYTAVFFDYVIKNGTNVRAGTVMACHDGSSNVEYNEVSTNDLGDTSDVTLYVDLVFNSGFYDIRLRATTTSDNWSIKSLVRAI